MRMGLEGKVWASTSVVAMVRLDRVSAVESTSFIMVDSPSALYAQYEKWLKKTTLFNLMHLIDIK